MSTSKNPPIKTVLKRAAAAASRRYNAYKKKLEGYLSKVKQANKAKPTNNVKLIETAKQIVAKKWGNSQIFNTFVSRAQKIGNLPTATAQNVIAKIIVESSKQGIDPCLGLAVAETESKFKQSGRSYAGAIGVMQLMPATARGLGVNPYDWEQNIEGGIRKLADYQHKRYNGNYIHMLVAYNAGSGNLSDALRAGLSGPSLDKITNNKCYARTVIGKIDTYRKLAGGNTGVYASYFGKQPVKANKAKSKGTGTKNAPTNRKVVAAVRKKGRGGRA